MFPYITWKEPSSLVRVLQNRLTFYKRIMLRKKLKMNMSNVYEYIEEKFNS